MRAFIALELGEALLDALEGAVIRLGRSGPGARWVRRESMHLTLAFLGEVSDSLVPRVGQVLDDVAARHPPHALAVRGSGTFGPLTHPRVLWAGVADPEGALGRLQRDVTQGLASLGLSPDHERFSPHITLARAKQPRGDALLEQAAGTLGGASFGTLEVAELVLFSSESGPSGMRYRAVHTGRLRGATSPG